MILGYIAFASTIGVISLYHYALENHAYIYTGAF